MQKFANQIWPYLKNKYVIAIAVFVIWIVFFSQYNLINRIGMAKNLRDLHDEKIYYREQIKRDSARLRELTTNNENLEKFAREQYYMKKPNEDIFVIIEE